MLETPASKSKSNPLTDEEPNGRRAPDPDCCGPNIAQSLSAAAVAADEDVNPPSVYVAPPIESMIVLPLL